MTRSFNPAQPYPIDGLFRPAGHVLVVAEGSALAILDLEWGVVYATTPFGTESWSTLVDPARPPRPSIANARNGTGDDEGGDAWAGLVGYLLDRRIIEPVLGGADIR